MTTAPKTGSAGYAAERETTEGRVFTVTGGDWDTVTNAIDPLSNEKIVVKDIGELLRGTFSLKTEIASSLSS